MEETPPQFSPSSQTQESTERKGRLSALLDLSAKTTGIRRSTMPRCDDQIGAAADSDDSRRQPLLVKGREFPPLIPSLARTENLSSRMPWILRRLHTSDGRLILREEKVRHHEYFKAHRSGGRLTLRLVPLEDDGFHLPIVDPETDDIGVNYEAEVGEECEEGESTAEMKENAAAVSGGGDWKCNLYSAVSPNSPCFLGVAAVAAAMGPVLG